MKSDLPSKEKYDAGEIVLSDLTERYLPGQFSQLSPGGIAAVADTPLFVRSRSRSPSPARASQGIPAAHMLWSVTLCPSWINKSIPTRAREQPRGAGGAGAPAPTPLLPPQRWEAQGQTTEPVFTPTPVQRTEETKRPGRFHTSVISGATRGTAQPQTASRTHVRLHHPAAPAPRCSPRRLLTRAARPPRTASNESFLTLPSSCARLKLYF